MKRLLIVLALIAFASVGFAADLTLATPETFAPPTATKLRLETFTVDPGENKIIYNYKFIAADGKAIPLEDGTTSRKFVCFDRPGQLAADCTGSGVPYNGCTGAGTGENLLPAVTCYTDTYKKNIAAGDVGKNTGKVFRTLLIEKLKTSVLSAGNTASE